MAGANQRDKQPRRETLSIVKLYCKRLYIGSVELLLLFVLRLIVQNNSATAEGLGINKFQHCPVGAALK